MTARTRRFLWELVVFLFLCVGWFAMGCVAALWMTP